jgi:hypothetical protein
VRSGVKVGCELAGYYMPSKPASGLPRCERVVPCLRVRELRYSRSCRDVMSHVLASSSLPSNLRVWLEELELEDQREEGEFWWVHDQV